MGETAGLRPGAIPGSALAALIGYFSQRGYSPAGWRSNVEAAITILQDDIDAFDREEERERGKATLEAIACLFMAFEGMTNGEVPR